MITKKATDCIKCPHAKVGIFLDMPRERLAELDAGKTTNVYKAGQVIFYEGNKPFGIYCICSGKVKLSKIGKGGRKQIVRMAKAGEILGYRAIFAGELYSASAEAIEDSHICFIERGTFLSVVEQDSRLVMNLLKKLSNDLRHAEDRLTSAVQKSVKQRLADVLCTLEHDYGSEKGGSIAISLSREEMAELADTTQETAIRLLSEFEKKGILKIDKRKITIVKSNELKMIAGIDFD